VQAQDRIRTRTLPISSDELGFPLRLSLFRTQPVNHTFPLIYGGQMVVPLQPFPFPPTTMPPRQFFVVLAGFLTITITVLLLRRPLSSLTPSFSYPDVFGSGRSLSSWLLEEEAGYSAFVQERHDALARLGEGFNP